MKSIFALFETYEDCEAAVDELLGQGFDDEEMNVVVDEEVAKTHLDVDLEAVDLKATDEYGEEAEGLDIILGTEQPLAIYPLGDVYAAGQLATILAKTAAAPDTGGFKGALVEFDVPEPVAGAYTEAVVEGAFLFWIRTGDERASEAAQILRVHNGAHVTSHAG